MHAARDGHTADFDLDYTVDDFDVDQHPDSLFLYQRVHEELLHEGTLPGGRTLDVACGTGRLVAGAFESGGEAVGIDPSREMLGLCRWVYPDERFPLVRAVAETLPFQDASFDRVICQCSLDHFVEPHAFMEEAARVVKPGGRVVIALSNYESLSCQFGRLRHWIAERLFRRPPVPFRAYWQPPPDHYQKAISRSWGAWAMARSGSSAAGGSR